MRRFSSTESGAIIARPSGTWAIPRRRILWAGKREMSSPSHSTRPEWGRTIPVMAFSSDDFPAPFGPRTATTPPAGTVRLTPRRARILPYRTSTFSTSSTVSRSFLDFLGGDLAEIGRAHDFVFPDPLGCVARDQPSPLEDEHLVADCFH